jgi:glutaredoxin
VDNVITVYGTWWCGDCTRVRRYFERNQIAYQWIDIDKNHEGEEFVFATNHGMRSVPTIVFGDNTILVEPTEEVLQQKLQATYREP